jgi:hypothetical protein
VVRKALCGKEAEVFDQEGSVWSERLCVVRKPKCSIRKDLCGQKGSVW